jgi:dynein light intermediate chain 1
MATTFSQPGSSHIATPSKRHIDRSSKRKEKRTDIWTSLLRQTRQAQARNRNNAVAHRQIVVCGGSPDDQRQFLTSIARPPPPAPPSRNRDQRDQKPKGQLNLSNRYAYGYGHMSLYSSPQVGTGGASFGQEAEEAAKLEAHTIAEPEAAYEPVLRRLLAPRAEEASEEQDEDDQDMLGTEIVKEEGRRPAVAILLSWREPWTFLARLREWLQLLAKAVEPNARPEEDIMELLKESKLAISLVVQHVEAQQDLERDGWQEETFDFVAQALRTSLLPLHPLTSLLFTSSSTPPQQPGSNLTEAQKTVYQSLDLDLSTLGPKATTGGAPAKAEDLLPRHNVVDRMNIVVPQGWDSAGKIRLLSEDFSPEEVLAAWQQDLSHPVITFSSTSKDNEDEVTPTDDNNAASGAPGEEVYASAVSPIEGENDIPSTSPSDSRPSAIASYETQIQDPNAHKRPKPPAITVTTLSEQDFLKGMRTELDNLIARDRERGDVHRTPAGTASGRGVGMPSGESTGALNELGDVSFNVGGVSYNTVSAEAAIERLKRPAQPLQQSQQSQATDGAAPSSSGSPRAGTTPRQPRREDRGDFVSTPTSGKSDFPSEDLEKYFASLAKKAGGAESSRAGTPSKQQ